MKEAQIVCLTLLFIVSCTTSTGKKESKTPNPLTAKWIHTETMYSVGGPAEWHLVEPAGQQIELKEDGSFISSASFLKGANKYELVDSVTIKFQPASAPPGYILMKYQLDAAGKELYLSQIEPACIEGCGEKFKR
jgi:hypothetical protein